MPPRVKHGFGKLVYATANATLNSKSTKLVAESCSIEEHGFKSSVYVYTVTRKSIRQSQYFPKSL